MEPKTMQKNGASPLSSGIDEYFCHLWAWESDSAIRGVWRKVG